MKKITFKILPKIMKLIIKNKPKFPMYDNNSLYNSTHKR